MAPRLALLLSLLAVGLLTVVASATDGGRCPDRDAQLHANSRTEFQQMAQRRRARSRSYTGEDSQPSSDATTDAIAPSATSQTQTADPWMPFQRIIATSQLVKYAELCLVNKASPATSSIGTSSTRMDESRSKASTGQDRDHIRVDGRLVDLSAYCIFPADGGPARLMPELFDHINASDAVDRLDILHGLFFLQLREAPAALLLERCRRAIGRDLVQYAAISSGCVRQFFGYTFDSGSDQAQLLLSALQQVDTCNDIVIANLIMSCRGVSFPDLIVGLVLNRSIAARPWNYTVLGRAILRYLLAHQDADPIMPTGAFISTMLGFMEIVSSSDVVSDQPDLLPDLLLATTEIMAQHPHEAHQPCVFPLSRLVRIITASGLLKERTQDLPTISAPGQEPSTSLVASRDMLITDLFLDRLCLHLSSLLSSIPALPQSADDQALRPNQALDPLPDDISNLIDVLTDHLYSDIDSVRRFHRCGPLRDFVERTVRRAHPEYLARYLLSKMRRTAPAIMPILLLGRDDDSSLGLIRIMFHEHSTRFPMFWDRPLDDLVVALRVFYEHVLSCNADLYRRTLQFICTAHMIGPDSDSYFAFVAMFLLMDAPDGSADEQIVAILGILEEQWDFRADHRPIMIKALRNLSVPNLLRVLPIILEYDPVAELRGLLSEADRLVLRQNTIEPLGHMRWIDIFYEEIIEEIEQVGLETFCEVWFHNVPDGLPFAWRRQLLWIMWGQQHQEYLSIEDLQDLLLYAPNELIEDEVDYISLDYKPISGLIIHLLKVDRLHRPVPDIALLDNLHQISRPAVELYEFLYQIWSYEGDPPAMARCRTWVSTLVCHLWWTNPVPVVTALSLPNAYRPMVESLGARLFYTSTYELGRWAADSDLLLFHQRIVALFQILARLPTSDLIACLRYQIVSKQITCNHVTDPHRVVLALSRPLNLADQALVPKLLALIATAVHEKPDFIFGRVSLIGEVLLLFDSITASIAATDANYILAQQILWPAIDRMVRNVSWSRILSQSDFSQVLLRLSTQSVSVLKDIIVRSWDDLQLSPTDRSILGLVLFTLLFSASSTSTVITVNDCIILARALELQKAYTRLACCLSSCSSSSSSPLTPQVIFALGLEVYECAVIAETGEGPFWSAGFCLDRLFTWALSLPEDGWFVFYDLVQVNSILSSVVDFRNQIHRDLIAKGIALTFSAAAGRHADAERQITIDLLEKHAALADPPIQRWFQGMLSNLFQLLSVTVNLDLSL